jgi:hypothetical protein
MTDEQCEYLFELKTVNTRPADICNEFNKRFYNSESDGTDGMRIKLLDTAALNSFYGGKHAKDGMVRYLEKQVYRIQELPFASPSSRIKKLGEIIDSEEIRTREKLEAIRQVRDEVKYIDDKLSASRPEPIVLLKMEALDDDDPLLDTENFTKTKQLFLQLVENYGEDMARELKSLIKEFKENGGIMPWEEPVRTIEAEIITDGNS